MIKTRSICHVVQSTVDIKTWSEKTPTVDQVRPCRCVQCEAASRPIGGHLQIIGHGLRSRQILGPLAVGQAPVVVIVLVRRFLCLVCHAVMAVVPQWVVALRLYSAAAIVLALALRAIQRMPVDRVRSLVCPWRHAAAPRRWVMLKRWVQAVGEGRLFADQVRVSPSRWSLEQIAARIVTSLHARGHPAAALLGDAIAMTG